MQVNQQPTSQIEVEKYTGRVKVSINDFILVLESQRSLVNLLSLLSKSEFEIMDCLDQRLRRYENTLEVINADPWTNAGYTYKTFVCDIVDLAELLEEYIAKWIPRT